MPAYYNECDPFAAQWLRNLIAAGHIAPGDVDERDIRTVQADDLRSYTQCHFFAGIGGWSLALRLAGWPDTRPVWTGSCPCQPYSQAGKNQGAADPRNLWPVWRPLIAQCRPERIFGEQVASAIGHGWLDVVCGDLEAEGYTVGAAVLGAHSVGAPHLRPRLYWVAHSHRDRGESWVNQVSSQTGYEGTLRSAIPDRGSSDIRIWATAVAIFGRHGKRYVVEDRPGSYPLAHGVPGRVGRLRAYGNAIVPQVAAEFIRASLAVTHG